MQNCFYYFKFCKLSGALATVCGTDFDSYNLQLLYTWHFSPYTQPIRCTYVLLSEIINVTFRSEHIVLSSAHVLTCQNLLNTWNIGNMLPNNLSNIYLSLHCNHDRKLTQVHTNTKLYCDGNCIRFLTLARYW